MSMNFGLLMTVQHPAGEPMSERVADLMQQVRLARDLGFSSVFSSQHFLTPGHQYLQPMPLLGRAAAEAGTMRHGTCIILTGLPNPVEIAEQVATMDAITGGRFILGVALGYRDVEFDAFGIPRNERVRQFESKLDVITRLLEGETVSSEEPYCQLDEATLSVKPLQSPRPPIWMGANSDKALSRVARMADTWLVNPHARFDTLQRQMKDVYVPALTKVGKTFPSELPMRREIFVAEDRQTAIREAAPWLLEKYKGYTEWGQDKVLPEGDDFAFEEAEELINDRFILGSPEECIREIDRYREALGTTEFIVKAQWPGMPNELAMQNIQRIGESLLTHYAKPGS